MRDLEIGPIPVLIILNISSNLGGVTTPVGDPPNIIISSHLGTSFSDFVWNIAPITLIVYLISLVSLMIMFRNKLRARIEIAVLEGGYEFRNKSFYLPVFPPLLWLSCSSYLRISPVSSLLRQLSTVQFSSS